MNQRRKKQKQRELTTACGEDLTRAAAKSPLVRSVLEILGIERMVREYALFWHESQCDEERQQAWDDYRKNVRHEVLLRISAHGAVGGIIHLVFLDPKFLLLIVALLAWLVRHLTK
jgi:hypothetical protein